MRRELRVVKNESIVGAVEIDRHGTPQFEGAAGEVLGRFRAEMGDRETARRIISGGWSNGYLYFGDPQ